MGVGYVIFIVILGLSVVWTTVGGFSLFCTNRAITQKGGNQANPRLGYLSLIMGVIAGIFLRLMFTFGPPFELMSFSFLFLSPLVIGIIYGITTGRTSGQLLLGVALFGPWGSTMLTMFTAAVLGLEGAICILMALPIWFAMASIGGFIAWIACQFVGPSKTPLSATFLLPLIIAPLEARVATNESKQMVINEVVIEAPAEKIWSLIKEVAPISESELPSSLASFMGFPNPVEARLVGEGVGAYRLATFAGGVEFHEEITEWEEPRLLSFGIKANTPQIPATTLDEHVTIGGKYFDMLNGKYEILPGGDGKQILRLSSSHRLTTHFNWYARLWSRAIMDSIQRTILQVIRKRAQEVHAVREG